METQEKISGCFDGLRGLEIEMTMEEAQGASHQGQCDDDVAWLTRRTHIAAQLDAIGADDIRAGLKESGAWDAVELADDYANRQRAVWLAACDIRENLPRVHIMEDLHASLRPSEA